MTRILAIDPGSEQSGWVLLDEGDPVAHGKMANEEMATWLWNGEDPADVVVVEWTAPRGMPASAQLFETLWWAGRFHEAAQGVATDTVERLERATVKRHLCGTTAAKDSNVRAALIDRYGGAGGKETAIGRKASPGPLYGIHADAWAALAVAVTWLDREEAREQT